MTLGATTYYFRTTFEFSGDPSSAGLQLGQIIDDGAVIYLNGSEVLRTNINSGSISHSTFAASSIGNASYVGPVDISAAGLV